MHEDEEKGLGDGEQAAGAANVFAEPVHGPCAHDGNFGDCAAMPWHALVEPEAGDHGQEAGVPFSFSSVELHTGRNPIVATWARARLGSEVQKGGLD